MYIYFQFTIDTNLSAYVDMFNSLVDKLKAIDKIIVKNVIVSSKDGFGGKHGILEIEIETTRYTSKNKDGSIYGMDILSINSVDAINVVAEWAKDVATYSLSINSFSVIEKVIETIADKNVDTLLKTILLHTGAKTIVGKFDINDIPHDIDTLELT